MLVDILNLKPFFVESAHAYHVKPKNYYKINIFIVNLSIAEDSGHFYPARNIVNKSDKISQIRVNLILTQL